MPPTHTDEGIVAAQEIRRNPSRPSACSSCRSISSRDYAIRLLEDVPERVGYLLKERVSDMAVLADALQRIDEGECVVDPTIVARLCIAPASTARSTTSPTANARCSR